VKNIKSIFPVENINRTRIDSHPKIAALMILISCIPTFLYYALFSDLTGSQIPWKISAFIQIIVPLTTISHYIFNKKSRRLLYEGQAALVIMIGLWMVVGSWPFMYFGFAPMSRWASLTGLSIIFFSTVFWVKSVFEDYSKYDAEYNLRKKLFIEKDGNFIYGGVAADRIILFLPQRNPLFEMSFIWFSAIGIAAIYFFLSKSSLEFERANGMFVLFSLLSFPLSQWMLGYIGVRIAYFHIYLPLKIESETGKKVILGP
jgi:hypothetical protein